MCPGGYILSSGTEVDGVVSNGMSNYHRNSAFANAAVVVTLNHEQRFGNDLFGGLKFRRKLEEIGSIPTPKTTPLLRDFLVASQRERNRWLCG